MESPECVLIGKWKHGDVQIYLSGITKKWGTTWGSLTPLQLFIWCPDFTFPPFIQPRHVFIPPEIYVLELHSALWVLFQPQRSLQPFGKKEWRNSIKSALCLHLSLFFHSLSFFFLFLFPTQPLTLFIIIIKHSFVLLTNWKALAGGHKGGVSGL